MILSLQMWELDSYCFVIFFYRRRVWQRQAIDDDWCTPVRFPFFILRRRQGDKKHLPKDYTVPLMVRRD